MRKIKLINLSSIGTVRNTNYFAPFSVDSYRFHSLSKRTPSYVYTTAMAASSFRRHKQNSYVEFSGIQENSVIFQGVRIGQTMKPKRRKRIEDILLLGSILTSHNWALYADRHTGIYPVMPKNRLRSVCKDATEGSKY